MLWDHCTYTYMISLCKAIPIANNMQCNELGTMRSASTSH